MQKQGNGPPPRSGAGVRRGALQNLRRGRWLHDEPPLPPTHRPQRSVPLRSTTTTTLRRLARHEAARARRPPRAPAVAASGRKPTDKGRPLRQCATTTRRQSVQNNVAAFRNFAALCLGPRQPAHLTCKRLDARSRRPVRAPIWAAHLTHFAYSRTEPHRPG